MIQLIKPFKVRINEKKMERGTNTRKNMTLGKLYDVLAIDNAKGTNEVILIDDSGQINNLKFHFAIAVLEDESPKDYTYLEKSKLESDIDRIIFEASPIESISDKAGLTKRVNAHMKIYVEGVINGASEQGTDTESIESEA